MDLKRGTTLTIEGRPMAVLRLLAAPPLGLTPLPASKARGRRLNLGTAAARLYERPFGAFLRVQRAGGGVNWYELADAGPRPRRGRTARSAAQLCLATTWMTC